MPVFYSVLSPDHDLSNRLTQDSSKCTTTSNTCAIPTRQQQQCRILQIVRLLLSCAVCFVIRSFFRILLHSLKNHLVHQVLLFTVTCHNHHVDICWASLPPMLYAKGIVLVDDQLLATSWTSLHAAVWIVNSKSQDCCNLILTEEIRISSLHQHERSISSSWSRSTAFSRV